MEKDKLILCDTNILIEFYKENPVTLKSLKSIGQENITISVISSAELIYGALNKQELTQIKKDISHLNVLDINQDICDELIRLMSEYSLSHNLTLPDGFIAATAIVNEIPLFTLNIKDFKFIKGLNLWK